MTAMMWLWLLPRTLPAAGTSMWTTTSLHQAADWDPDEEPWRFASGIGHNLLELAVRLRRRGHLVSLGTRIPRNTGVVVYFQHAWAPTRELSLAIRAAPYSTVLIRSDAPLWYTSLLDPDLIVAPNVAGVRIWSERSTSRVVHIPALPQRGMRPRDTSRTGVRALAFKGNPVSVPGFVGDPDFIGALDALSVDLIVDAPAHTDGPDQTWHDFTTADAVLCTRDAAPGDSLLNKPATRLINAWRAGAIPLVGPEPAYLELVTDGVDGFVVTGPEDILQVLRRLDGDASLEARVRAAVQRRATDYDPDLVLDRWVASLAEVVRPRRPLGQTVERQASALGRYGVRMTRRTAGSLRRAVLQIRG